MLDGPISEQPWETAVMVADFNNRKRMFGYCFWGVDGWEAATPDGFEALDLFGELQEATRVSGGEGWSGAKLTVDRASRRVACDFDYVGTKWTPNYADPAGFARSLLLVE